jgi:serine protease SohB
MRASNQTGRAGGSRVGRTGAAAAGSSRLTERARRGDDAGMADYLLFLARAVTLVVLVLVAVAGTAAIVSRAGRRARHRPRLEITDLGRRYDELRRTMQRGLLPRRAARRQITADRRRAKAARTTSERATSVPEPGVDARRRRVFVVDFLGDLRASAVTALREEDTAILSVTATGDEVLVRLENPGGLVTDQGLAASQLQRLRDRGVPLTVAVDKVAASGGYMMACVADRIVAAPFALVGSIGVIAQVPNVRRLLDRYGVRVDQFKGGEYKRTVTPFGEPTEAERAKLTEEIEETHALFKDHVARYRPGLDVARVATGEAWYGSRALELRLVDELTTSDDYLLAARDTADLYRVRYRPDRPVGRGLLPRMALLLRSLTARSAVG